MLQFSLLLDKINEQVGQAVSWFTALLVGLICIDVLMRYLFNFSLIWMGELEIYFFALCFLLGSGYAFKHDKHVRVDLFYSKFSEKGKARVNLIGGLLFLVPWTIIIIIVASRYAFFSFKIGESSPQVGGLPALYILKFSIVAGFILLLLQGISSILQSILTLMDKNPKQA